MARVKQQSKMADGPPSNFNYVFECTCANGAKHEAKVTSANDNGARSLAHQECEEKCGE